MKAWLLLMVGLLGVGCSTTTTVGPGGGPTPRWVAPNAAPDVTVETDRGPDPTVVVEATSPTEIRYRAEGETVVPIGPLHPAGPSRRRVRTHQGMWIGAGLGILAGLALPSPPADEAHDCELSCGGGAAALGAVAFGAIGLGLGAAVGAIIGSIEGP